MSLFGDYTNAKFVGMKELFAYSSLWRMIFGNRRRFWIGRCHVVLYNFEHSTSITSFTNIHVIRVHCLELLRTYRLA